MKWLNDLFDVNSVVSEDTREELTLTEVTKARRATDAVIKALSTEWKVDKEDYRLKLFPVILDWMNK
jgi:hypothetical protein